jgi:hypothetical protein
MGNVIAFDVPGGTFKCAYGEMQITNAGTSDVSPGSSRSPGKATLDVASKGGDLRVISKMGNVTLNNVRSGSVDLSYGNAEVNLSKHFGGDVIAVTRFGSVDTDLDLEHSSSGGPGDTEEKLSGSVGSGSDRLIVKNKFGNIDLQQE